MTGKGYEKDKYLYMYVVTGVICLVIIIATVAAIVLTGSRDGAETSSEPEVILENSSAESGEDLSGDMSDTSKDTSAPQTDIEYKEIVLAESAMKEGLLACYSPDSDTFPVEKEMVNIWSTCNSSNFVMSGIKWNMYGEAAKKLDAMLADFKSDSGKTVMINRAYMSSSELADDNLMDTHVDLVTGNTVEIQVYGDSGGSMGEGIYKYFETNCYKFGYILRYPPDKKSHTGIASRFLFRYVGEVHARAMKSLDVSGEMCLEEYLDMLKTYDYKYPLEFENHLIYYVAADTNATSAKVPKSFPYTVSGDNIGGYIITVDLSGNDNDNDTSSEVNSEADEESDEEQ